MRFFLLSLLALAACNNGGNSDCDNCGVDDTSVCEGCGDDTGTQTMGGFTAPWVDLLGSEESCTSNLTAASVSYLVSTGTTEEVKATDYVVTFGDASKATVASAGLPIHTSSDGTMGITPPVTVAVYDGEITTVSTPVMSRYVGGETWTCNNAGSLNVSTSQTTEIYYEKSGSTLLIGINGTTMVIEGDALSATIDCDELDGEFMSSTQLTYHAACAMGDNSDTECWKGTLYDRPTDW